MGKGRRKGMEKDRGGNGKKERAQLDHYTYDKSDCTPQLPPNGWAD